MPGDEIQPRLLIPLMLALLGCTVFTWFCALQIFFGHWKPDWRLWIRRGGHLVIFSAVLVVGSKSQNQPAWSQEQRENEARFREQDALIRRIEGDLRVHVDTEKIIRDGIQRDILKNSTDLREIRDTNEQGRKSIEADVSDLKAAEQWRAGATFVMGGLGSLVLYLSARGIEWLIGRRNGRTNGHNNGGSK